MWQKQEARDAFSLSLHVNRHDMGRERDGRSNSSYSFLLNETVLPLPRFLDVEAWLAIRQTWSEFGDRHRSRSRTWFREREREREREILRDEQTTSDSAGDRRRGTIESSKTRVQAKSFCIPLLTRLLNLLRNREATYIRLGWEAEYTRRNFGEKYLEKEIGQKLKTKILFGIIRISMINYQ